VIGYDDLPALNAALNATSFVLVATGWLCIRRRKVAAHKACMITAMGISTLFLVSYVVYHLEHGTTRFPVDGWPRVLYFSVLFTHTPLAATLLPLIGITAARTLRGDFERHRRIARWTLPIWLYVSLTGVSIWFMLYRVWPS